MRFIKCHVMACQSNRITYNGMKCQTDCSIGALPIDEKGQAGKPLMLLMSSGIFSASALDQLSGH